MLDLAADRLNDKTVYEGRLKQLESSHSHSWFGDHSLTYYQDFQSPPPGDSFDVEWGFIPGFHGRRNRSWVTFSREEIQAFAFDGIAADIFDDLKRLDEEVTGRFSVLRDQAIDLFELLSKKKGSKALARYGERLEKLQPHSPTDYLNSRLKNAPRGTRDSREIHKGQMVPPHVAYLASLESLRVTKYRLREMASVLRNAIEAATLGEPSVVSNSSAKIFIGHGRSEQWRMLKDFIRERLNLQIDEFNRVSTAGISTQERLSEMLRECGFAFLVLTAEDIHDDESLHARENVIHEAGLFQGRLGWRRAIVLLEESCAEFSNITGLGQIRFPPGKLAAAFEEVRQVLEREGFLKK